MAGPVKGAGRITRLALLTAIALTIFLAEAQIPAFTAVPGVKLGLGNLVVIVALYRLGPGPAVGLSLVRALLSSLTFGNAYALAYSLAGAAVSLAVMLGLKRTGRFSILGVSAAGGVGHNIGQILVAMLVVENAKLLYYLPVLLLSGTIAGVAVGVVAAVLTKRLERAGRV